MARELGKRKRDDDISSRKNRKLSPPQEEEGLDDLETHISEAASEDDPITLDHSSKLASTMPTANQVRQMKDANELYRSSSFKLQIDALLPNVRPKFSKSQPLDRFLMLLHTFLGSLTATPPVHPLEGSRKLRKKGITIPFTAPLPAEDVKWKVAFDKPTDITLVGSWANKISVKGQDGVEFGVDLVIEMPSTLFQEKDYLDGRLFHKKAYYLAALAAALKDRKKGLKDVEVSYACPSGNPRLTHLTLQSRHGENDNFSTELQAQVNIILVLSEEGPIPLARLSPSHSNLRDPTTQEHLPSPLYNAAILSCTSTVVKADLLNTFEDKSSCAAFPDAVALLRVWANQRGYGHSDNYGIRGFSAKGPFWNALLHYLLVGDQGQSKRRPLGKGLSSYQMFRGALDFLAKHNFTQDPVFVKSESGSHRYPASEYQALVEDGSPVFVEASSTVNLLAGVPLGSLDLLREDARQTLERLNGITSKDPFNDVFLQDKRDLSTRFDVVLRVDISSSQAIQSLDVGSDRDTLISQIDSILRRGLGDRIHAIAFLQPSPTLFPLSQTCTTTTPTVIHLGLILNTENAFRLVDHGPAADDADPTHAAAFRGVWKDKAELRRFKDGRILESVVWDVKTAEEKMHIPGMVVQYLLETHFRLKANTVQASFDKVLRLPESISSNVTRSGVKVGFKNAIVAFDAIVKAIRNLGDEIPLSLANVSPVSEYLRYTSVFSPAPLPPSLASRLPSTAQYQPEMEIILEFEKSSRWPDDLKAIQKIKLAFFETIASALMTSMPGLVAQIVVGDGTTISEIVDQGRLVIITQEGWAFSARIYHDREATLMDRILEDKAKAKKFPGFRAMSDGKYEQYGAQEVDQAKEVHIRRFIHAPRHHRAIAALSHRHSAFSGTVRLVKRWLAAHWLLRGHVSEEAVEIICAKFFISSTTQLVDEKMEDSPGVPATKERGFALVIDFLRNWRWDQEDLVVPLYANTSTPVDTPALPASLVKQGVWRVVTEADKDGKMWTSDHPQVVSANRIRALAHATWECLATCGESGFDPQTIFVHPTDDYNLILDLDPSVLPRYAQNVQPLVQYLSGSRFANLPAQERQVRTGCDPAQLFVDDLRRVYDGTLKIFHDILGGNKVGIIWDPTLLNPRPFRVLGGYTTLPVEEGSAKKKSSKEQQVVLNKEALVGEIMRLGEGLLDQILQQ
ncbi:Nrap protein [Flagelloscypha sp. PMI_526]|nr:Nrap protein [Flagelloscypha sp. PMI_526]